MRPLFLGFLIGLSLTSFSAFSQVAAPIAVNPANHTTVNQNAIQITFTKSVRFTAAPVTTSFIVRVAGTPVAVSSVTPGAGIATTVILVTFDATSVNTWPSVNRGQTLTVEYTGGGNLITDDGSGTVVNFGALTSVNDHIISCTDFSFVRQGPYNPALLDLCDPVKPSAFYEYFLSKRAYNSTDFSLGNMNLRVAWNNPGGTVDLYAMQDLGYVGGGLNRLLRADPNSGPTSTPPSAQAGGSTSGFNFNYPATDAVCSYTAQVQPRLLNLPEIGGTCGGGLSQNTTFQSYARDNENTGTVTGRYTPTPLATSNLVCLGTNASVQFSDNTLLNCRTGIGAPNPAPNDFTRWIRFVYGDPADGPGPYIPNIVVNGTTLTDATGNYIGPAGGYVVTGAGAPNTPDFNGVVEIPPSVTAPTGLTHSRNIITTSTTNQAVGQRFYVKMQYWNVCNQYTGTVSDFDAATNFVEVIGSPDAPPVSPSGPFCESDGDPSFTFTASGIGTGALAYTWYKEAALTTVLQGPSADNTFNPITDGPGGDRITKAVGSSTTFHRYVTVTQGSNNCTSQPTDIVIRIDNTNTGGTIAHPLGGTPILICNATDPAAFTSTSDGTGGGPAGTFTHQWQSSTTSAVAGFSDIAGATGNVHNPSALPVTTWFRRRLISGDCNAVSSNVIEFRVSTPVVAGSISGAETLCLTADPDIMGEAGPPSGGDGIYTFQWEESTTSALGPFNTIIGATANTFDSGGAGALSQTTHYRRRVTSGVCTLDGVDAGTDPDIVAYSNVVTKTVDQLVDPGSVGNPQEICAGDNPAILTEVTPPGGGDGATYTFQWQQSVTGGGAGFAAAAGINTGSTYDPPVLAATTFYRRRVTSGQCSATFSNEIEVTVNALPTAAISGGGSICQGTAAPPVEFDFTGTGPWTLVYAMDGVNQPPVVVNTSPYQIINPGGDATPDGILYTIVSVADANSPVCTVTAPLANIDNSANVAVEDILIAPPSLDTFTAMVAVCDDGVTTNPPDALLDLQPNQVETYSIKYRLKNLATLVDGPVITIPSVASDGNGVVVISPTYAQMGGAPEPLGYQIIITEIFNTVTLCAGAVPINGPALIINPRPAASTSNGNVTVCSDAINTAEVSVTAPAGSTIDWWSNPTGGSILAGGTGVAAFDPAASDEPLAGATATYYAESRNSATGCLSTSRIAVTLTSDARPTNPMAQGNDQTCGTAYPLVAAVADNGGIGFWSTGNTVYYENFDNLPGGAVGDNGIFGWTRNITGIILGVGDYFEVRSGVFSSEDLENGTVTAFWRSNPIDVSALTNIDISIDLIKDGELEATDFIEVYRVLDGVPVKFGEISRAVSDGTPSVVNVTATSNGLNVSASNTLVIEVRVRSNANLEIQSIDNVIVKTTGSSPVTFDDIFDETTTVRNLQDGANVVQWNVVSALGSCALTPAQVTITKIVAPLAINLTDAFCEELDMSGVGTGNVTTINLADYDDDVAGGSIVNRSVTWFSDADRTSLIGTPGSVTVSDGFTAYAIVTETLSGLGCVSLNRTPDPGKIDFTVSDRPTVANQTDEFGEDLPLGSNQHAGVNLNSYNASIHPTATITWFESYTLAGEVFCFPHCLPRQLYR
jgi:hypothetical protein